MSGNRYILEIEKGHERENIEEQDDIDFINMDEFELMKYLDSIAPSRENAEILIGFAEDYDLFCIYGTLFERFIPYLTSEEMNSLTERVSMIFDASIWETID